MTARIAVIMFALLLTGCFQARYVNLTGRPAQAAVPSAAEPVRVSGWQSFFLYGLAPDVVAIDARRKCGGVGNIQSIKTQLTFAQGLVGSLAGFYINIYSPYDGAVYCHKEPGLPGGGSSLDPDSRRWSPNQ